MTSSKLKITFLQVKSLIKVLTTEKYKENLCLALEDSEKIFVFFFFASSTEQRKREKDLNMKEEF